MFRLSRCAFSGISVLCVIILVLIAAPAKAGMILTVSNSGNGTVVQFDSAGNPNAFATGLSQPSGLAFNAAGDLYVANGSNHTIAEVPPTGGNASVIASTGSNHPIGLALDSAGNVYVAYTFGSGDSIHEFSPSGADLGTFASSGLDFPYALAFDKAGNLYVANESSGTIRKFSPTGTDLGYFATGLDVPVSLAFDSHGNLYVSNFEIGTIQEFSPTGANLGDFVSGLYLPQGLAFDPAGNLYVIANTANDVHSRSVIHEFSATGADLGIFATNGLNGPAFLAFQPALSAVPEPSTLVLAFPGIVGVLCLGWTRRKVRSILTARSKIRV